MGSGNSRLVPSFGRHETFHPRYGWLKKAYDQISADPGAFRADDAIVRFGVGKNMVSSIRYWSLAFKITEEQKGGLRTTEIGDTIFGRDGFDPYLEKPETLWILHWLLLSQPCRIPTWWMIMNRIRGTAIETDRIRDRAWSEVEGSQIWEPPSRVSVRRDVDAFLHTYTSRRDRLTIEEYIDCPFRNMRLARHSRGTVRFTYGPKPGLSPEVVAFAGASFADQVGASRDISVSRLAVEPGGPGNTFKINENDITASIEFACNRATSMSMVRINGEPHVRFPNGAADTAAKMLRAAYSRSIKAMRAVAGAAP